MSRVKVLVTLSPEEGTAIREYVKGWLSNSPYNLKQLSQEVEMDQGQFSRIIQGRGAIAQEKLEKIYSLLQNPSELSFIEKYRVKFVGESQLNEQGSHADYLYSATKMRLDSLYEKAELPKKLEILSKLEAILQEKRRGSLENHSETNEAQNE